MTWVFFVPKEDDDVYLGKYRPISMVGCLYKSSPKFWPTD